MVDKKSQRFNWSIIQKGRLQLKADGRIIKGDHRCTSILVWPEDESPEGENVVLTDPCFTRRGYQIVLRRLKTLGASLDNIGRVFVTHEHHDHIVHMPDRMCEIRLTTLWLKGLKLAEGLSTRKYPGHLPEQFMLIFRSTDDKQVWVVGDSVLDEEWLLAWGYYWPNGYSRLEIIQAWRTIAAIVNEADVIVPGHGMPIYVTKPLVEDLLAGFPKAEHTEDCPDVADSLRERLARFS